MMSLEDFDFQFLDEGLENEIGFAGSDGIIKFLEPENPVLADPSLASVASAGDDFLAYDSTDPWATFTQESYGPVKKTQTSPWHESDSGMSDATYLGSPQSYTQEDTQQYSKTKSGRKQMKAMEVLTVEEDIDVESINQQMSLTSSSGGLSPPSTSQGVEVNVDFGDLDENSKRALEFFQSDLFEQPSKIKVLSLQKNHNQTEQWSSDDKSKKNAIQAKINREKKKAYMKSLEDEIKALKSDNSKLASENKRMQQSTADLQEEVEYLKSVLVNSSALSHLLKNITNVKEVKLSATIIGKKRSAEDDHSYNILESAPEKRARRINENLQKAGVCLHVNGGSACLEFCAHCSRLAQKSSASS